MSQAQELLISELLGDIGKLHDEIKALPDAIAPTIGAIVSATQQAKISLDNHAEVQKSDFHQFGLEEKRMLQKELQASIDEAAGKIVRKAVLSLEESAAVHLHTQKAERRFIAITALSMGLLGSVLGGLVLLYLGN